MDVHALPFDGAPLLALLPVDYPIGLRAEYAASSFERRGLIVGDPSGNLPGAQAEGRFAGKALAERTPARTLLGADATSPAVSMQRSEMQRLDGADMT